MKTLVVEDGKTSLKAVCQHLEHMGIQPIPAVNGEEALAAFASQRPDIVLLDIVLPDIDGFEVARRLRAQEAPGEWTPIIFLTARDADEDVEQGIAAGGDDYLRKPISDIVLRAKIRAMQRIVQMRYSLLALTKKLDIANQELKRLSTLDGLTGIANRRQFDEILEREWRRALRQKREISLVMCDVDFFKAFNDALGHLAGDDCLRRVAQAMVPAMDRGGDLLARYGGEEFGIILPETSLGGAAFVAERMRHSVHQMGIPHPRSTHQRVSISCGVATLVPNEQHAPADLVRLADEALYEAKRDGRNCVRRGPPPTNAPTHPSWPKPAASTTVGQAG